MPPTIECRAFLPIANGHQAVHIDVRFSEAPEVWLSTTDIVGGQVTRQSAVWRSSGWATIIGTPCFDPAATLRRVVQARPWDKEPPEEMRDDTLSVIHIAAGLGRWWTPR